MNILVWVIFGALAGWLAEMITKSSMGLMGNIVLGIVGAFIGGFLANLLGGTGITGFNLYSILIAVLGASVLIFLARLLRR